MMPFEMGLKIGLLFKGIKRLLVIDILSTELLSMQKSFFNSNRELNATILMQ